MTASLLVSGFAIFGLLLTSAAIPLIRRVALRIDLVDDPDAGAYKTHSRITPYGGGVAIWFGALLPVAAVLGWLVAERSGIVHDGLEWVSPWAPYFLFPLEQWNPTVLQVSQTACVLVAASVVMLLGLADDRRELPPTLRFAVQVALATALACFVPGFRLAPFGGGAALSIVMSVVWIVSLTNAFNFIDNMNGLAAGVAVVCLGTCAALALAAEHLPMAVVCLAVTGATAGFLIHNFPAASIFMGDAGGLFLGFLAGAVSVSLSARLAEMAVGPGSLPFRLLPMVPFCLPLYDLVTVVFLRLRRGVAPWIGDTRHVSHRLVAAGFGRLRTVLALCALNAAIAFPCAIVIRFDMTAWWAVLGAAGLLSLFGGAEIAMARRQRADTLPVLARNLDGKA